MGVVINHELYQDKKFVKNTNDEVQEYAEKIVKPELEALKIPIEIIRRADDDLLINIGECESLVFHFKHPKDIEEWEEKFMLIDKDKLHENTRMSKGFCKTQYCEKIEEHIAVANLVRCAASRCEEVRVYDEGGYYHSGKVEDAIEAIKGNGALINAIGGQLKGGRFDVIQGGVTKIGKKTLKDVL